jgi:hypothetical protein
VRSRALAETTGGACGRSRTRPPAGPASWVGPLGAIDGGAIQASRPRRVAWFRVGDRRLCVASGGDSLLEEMEERYGDCVVPDGGPEPGDVVCEVAVVPGAALLCLTFTGAGLPDPLEAAGTPFRIVRDLERYALVDGPLAGWRMLVDGADGDRPVAASDGRRLVLDRAYAPVGLATDAAVNVAQAAQSDLLFLHAASFGVGNAGGLLMGWSGSGKSTTALALAAAGHAFLGDDVAAVRIRNREILPFPRTVRLRPGAYVRSLERRLLAAGSATAAGEDGLDRTLVSMAALFPRQAPGALPLRHAFLLDGFGDRARLTPYLPRISDLERLRPAVNGATPHWGHSAGRDLLRFLALVDVLSGADCHLVKLGTPEETAASIVAAMEAA